MWDEFLARFNSRIVKFVIRERNARGVTAGPREADIVSDLVQEVYVRLLAHDRRALSSFRGDSEYAVLLYLAKVARAVVGDDLRKSSSQKRAVHLVSIDADPDSDMPDIGSTIAADERTSPEYMMSDRLVIERLRKLLAETGSPNATRDALIFQLHVLEGLSAREIAAIPEFGMSVAAVEAVIRRTRDRLKAMLDSPSGLSM